MSQEEQRAEELQVLDKMMIDQINIEFKGIEPEDFKYHFDKFNIAERMDVQERIHQMHELTGEVAD